MNISDRIKKFSSKVFIFYGFYDTMKNDMNFRKEVSEK